MEDFEKELLEARSQLKQVELKLSHICWHETIGTPVHRQALQLLKQIRKIL
jgi:hypothetical protein